MQLSIYKLFTSINKETIKYKNNAKFMKWLLRLPLATHRKNRPHLPCPRNQQNEASTLLAKQCALLNVLLTPSVYHD